MDESNTEDKKAPRQSTKRTTLRLFSSQLNVGDLKKFVSSSMEKYNVRF